MDIVDVVVHVEERLGNEAQQALEERLRQREGVIAPRFSEGRPHLLVVAYNPARIGSAALLKAVRDEGYQARLVGM